MGKKVVFQVFRYVLCPDCGKLLECVYTDFSEALGIIAPGLPNARCPFCNRIIGRLRVELEVFD